MRPDRFPKVNDVMLAEALRQVLATPQGSGRVMPMIRAHTVLEMWLRQLRGRAQLLDGPLPPKIELPRGAAEADESDDPGQTIPVEAVRPNRPRRSTPAKRSRGAPSKTA
jgi:hypothetical protein